MKRFTKKLTVAVLSLGSIGGAVADLQACPRGGGGYSSGHSYSRPAYSQPSHSYPVYSQPTYPQSYPSQIVHSQPLQHPHQQVISSGSQQVPPILRGSIKQPSSQFPANQQQFSQQVGQPQFNGGTQQNSLNQQQIGQPQFNGARQVNSGGQNQVRVAGRQPVGQAGGQMPTNNSFVNGQSGNTPAPNTQNPNLGNQNVGNPSPTNPNVGNSNAAENSAQLTALQILAGLAAPVPSSETSVPQTPAEPQVQGPSHIGEWSASLPNSATVQLSLQADGNFSWTANANGKSSAFEGTYELNGESLTLTRSSDAQKLAGTFTQTENGGFNFKLNGAKDAGLNFMRSQTTVTAVVHVPLESP